MQDGRARVLLGVGNNKLQLDAEEIGAGGWVPTHGGRRDEARRSEKSGHVR